MGSMQCISENLQDQHTIFFRKNSAAKNLFRTRLRLSHSHFWTPRSHIGSYIGHWKKLHSKVSQGGARGARMNIFQ